MPQIRQTERRIKVLDLLRKGEKEIDIAPKLRVSRETIVRDVKWLRQNIIYDFTLITNEIIQKLHERIDTMTNYELIAFFGKLYTPTHKMEVKEEITERFEGSIYLDVTEDEDSILNKAASILDKRLPKEQETEKREGEPTKIH